MDAEEDRRRSHITRLKNYKLFHFIAETEIDATLMLPHITWSRKLDQVCDGGISSSPPDPRSVRGDNCLSGINREINEFISGGEFSRSQQHLPR